MTMLVIILFTSHPDAQRHRAEVQQGMSCHRSRLLGCTPETRAQKVTPPKKMDNEGTILFFKKNHLSAIKQHLA